MENSNGSVMYLSNYFHFPEDLKNDLIYLQRSLISHIRIHQMIVDIFQHQTNIDLLHRKRIIQELEMEIYEINAEQQYIFIKLRCIIDEYLKKINIKNDEIPKLIMHKFISNIIIPAVADTNIECNPINVVRRKSECSLIEEYFEVKLEEPNFGNENQLDMNILKERVTKHIKLADRKTANNLLISKISSITNTSISSMNETMQTIAETTQISNKESDIANTSTDVDNSTSTQVSHNSNERCSLLKPIAKKSETSDEPLSIKNEYFSKVLQINDPTDNEEVNNGNKADATISTNVRRSRMNLRQALKRAQEAVLGPTPPNDSKTNITSKTSKEVKSVSPTSVNNNEILPKDKAPASSSTTTTATTSKNAKKVSKKRTYESTETVARSIISSLKDRNMNNSNRTNCNTIAINQSTIEPPAVNDSDNNLTNQPSKKIRSMETSSSSEEENVCTAVNETLSQETIWTGKDEYKTRVYQFSKHGFLRLFNLYTPEECAEMKQRRSKRRRRCVENNNRSYYLYGKSENNAQPSTSGLSSNIQYDSKMKHNSFLLTLQVVKKTASNTVKGAKRTYTTRATKSKKPDVGDASDSSVTVRSQVSSRRTSSVPDPDNTRQCNECNCTNDETLWKCFACKRYFHKNCALRENNVEDEQSSEPLPKSKNKSNLSNITKKQCPSCEREYKRLFKAKKTLNQSLQQIIEKLQTKMTIEQNRRDNLQREGEQFTFQMNNIIKAVNCFKFEEKLNMNSLLPSTSTSLSDWDTSGNNSSPEFKVD